MDRPNLHLLGKQKKDEPAPGGASSSEQFEASFQALAERLREFRDEREWGKFHTPRNLAMSVSIEAGELLEQFQWLAEDQPQGGDDLDLEAIREEAADVVIYVIQLAEVLGLSLAAAIDSKIELNAERYPVTAARGSSAKYTKLISTETRSSA